MTPNSFNSILISRCKISDLLYNPYDSNSEEYMGFQDFDPGTNFYIEKNKTYTMDYYAITILRIHSMTKLTVWIMFRLKCLHYAIWIFAVLTQIFLILKTSCSYWKSISQLLVSQRLGSMITNVICLLCQDITLLSLTVKIEPGEG